LAWPNVWEMVWSVQMLTEAGNTVRHLYLKIEG